MKASPRKVAGKFMAYLLSFALLFSSFAYAGQASAAVSDIKGHWAEEQLNNWLSKGLLKGYPDGSVKPNNAISRAELAALINRSFGYETEKEISFSDVRKGQWTYAEVAKAVQAGYADGYNDGKFRPNQPVTRQETAVMLARVLKLSTAATDNLSSFKDAAKIADWGRSAISNMVAKSLINGYEDGTLRPNANLTRAEAVTLIDRSQQASAVSVTYDKAGTYGPATGSETVTGNVTITVTGVTLQNTVIRGNLILGSGIGEGDVTLKNVKVEGTTTVNGGGANSIHLIDSILAKLLVNKAGGAVRIVVQGTTVVAETVVQSSVTLEESGLTGTGTGFVNVLLSKELPANSTVTIIGDVNKLTIEAAGVKLIIQKGSVDSVVVTGTGVVITVNNDAKIASLVLNALTKILGTGTVQNATVNEGGKGSSFEKPPVKVDGPQAGSIGSGSTGGGGGGGSSSYPAAPAILNVAEGQTYKTAVLPNWTDAAGTTSTATLNGELYTKGTGITKAGEYTLAVTTTLTAYGTTALTTVKFKVEPQKVSLAYVAGWSLWSDANPIDVSKLTHIDYAFTRIDENHKLYPFAKDDDKNFPYLLGLKQKNPDLKLLTSIGGWAADGFSDAVFTEEARQTFTDSIVNYVATNKLDGVDVDWEYPTQTAGDTKGRPEDKQNFTLFLKLLREKLNVQGLVDNKYYELTIAAGVSQNYLNGVEIQEIIKYLDYINLMTYDFSGGWVTNTTHHTNLLTSPDGPISIDSSVKLYKTSGVPSEKLVIGAAYYSHVWTDVPATNHGLGQKGTGSGETPTYSVIATTYNAEHGYTRYWDEVAKAPYLYNPTTKVFLTYDDRESVYEKAKYAVDNNLGGMMFWEYSNDTSGALLSAQDDGLKGKPFVPDTAIVPAAPMIRNVENGKTYTSAVLPNWTDAAGTTSTATVNGEPYTKGTGIGTAGEYTLTVTATLTASGGVSSTTVKFKVEPQKVSLAYVAGWSIWSDANPIDVSKLTHIDYAFTRVDNNHKLYPFSNDDDKNIPYLLSLKQKNPNLKILTSIGGWGADGFSDAVFTEEARQTFTDSIVQYVSSNKLDGVDVDWEYPTNDEGGLIKARKEDKENYTLFLKLLREKLNAQGLIDNKHYETTIVAGAGYSYLDGVEIAEVAKYLDYVNLMTYDFAGGWQTTVNHHTNLFTSPGGSISIDSTVKRFEKNGVPAEKLVVGAAYYSHLWTDVGATNNGLGQEGVGSSSTPTYSVIATTYNAANGYVRHWDDVAKAPYLYNPSSKVFLTYDDPESIYAKAKYAVDNNLGGIMFWEYSGDLSGALLSAQDDALKGKPFVADTTTVPAAPVIHNVKNNETYTSAVLPNWKDAPGTISYATLKNSVTGVTYSFDKGTGVNAPGTYELTLTAVNGKSFKTASTTVTFTVEPKKIVLAYIPGWVDWSVSNAVYGDKLTHIDYAFTLIGPDHKIYSRDKNDAANFEYLHSLKKTNPDLKILTSVGGWGADGFSDAVLPENRDVFAKSIVDFIVKYKLDGVDLDWEFPTFSADDAMKARPEDKVNYIEFLKVLRARLSAQSIIDNKYYEISMVSNAGGYYSSGVDVKEAVKYLDYINVMSYDFAGGWMSTTDHHTNLSGGAISVESAIAMYRSRGAADHQLVVGAAFYGHIWTDVESDVNNGLRQKAKGSSETPTYNDILAQYNEAHGFVRYWDPVAKAPYLYNAATKVFVTYDDPESVKAKAEYVLNQNLGGIMFWEYSQDSSGKLLDAMNEVIPAVK